MSPELIEIRDEFGKGEFNPELSDVFSLGVIFLRVTINCSSLNEIIPINILYFDKKYYL